jgi:hypothetical protein
MSGGCWSNPGDASTPIYLFEDKFTEAEHYVIQRRILEKIGKQARFKSRIPIFRFGFRYLSTSEDYIIVEGFYIALDFFKNFQTQDWSKPSMRVTKDWLKQTFVDTDCIQFQGPGLYYMFPYEVFVTHHDEIIVSE